MAPWKHRLAFGVAQPLPYTRSLDDILQDIDDQVERMGIIRARAVALIGRIEERTGDGDGEGD